MPSMRTLTIFLFAAAALNLTNYMFYWFYPPLHMRTYGQRRGSLPGPVQRLTVNVLCGENNNCNKTEANISLVDDMGQTEPVITTLGSYTYYAMKTKKRRLPLCPETPPDLGPVLNDSSMNAMKSFDRMYLEVETGGIYKPASCTARQSVAIIIPYRGNKKRTNIKHLGTFLYMLHPFLMKQQLEYQVFVVEQANPAQAFNHGMLINAGFAEVNRRRSEANRFHCVVIHEPYLVPVDTRNLYRCSRYPRQLAVTVENSFKSIYNPKFGGAIAISTEQYITVNGFSNIYWENDGDYEDLYKRLSNAYYSIERNRPHIGKYTTLKNFELPVTKKSETAHTASPLNLIDGLTTLSYTVNEYDLKYVFTYINISFEDNKTVTASALSGGTMLEKLVYFNMQEITTT